MSNHMQRHLPAPSGPVPMSPMRPFYLNDGYGVELEGARSAAPGWVTGLSSQAALVVLQDPSAAGALSPGELVRLRFTDARRASSRLAGTLVSVDRVSRSGREVIELAICFDADGAAEEAPELPVAEFHQPLASCASSLLHGEWRCLRVTAFSSSGLRLLAPNSGGGLVPGEQLSLCVPLPTAEPWTVDVEVRQVEPSTVAGYSQVRVRLARPEPRFLEAVSEFLLARAGVSLRRLREAGFPLGDIGKALSFSYVASAEEMDELLRLRLAAYQSKGKRMHVLEPEGMRDRFDAFSRQITCRINGVLVASARVTFNDGDLSRSEYLSYGVRLPEWVTRERFVEVGRVVTHPDYRGASIVFRLMQELARVSLQSGAHYIIGSATDALGLYERVGFRALGLTYDAHGMTGAQVIFLDLHEVFHQVGGLDFVSWNLIALPIVESVERTAEAHQVLSLSPASRVLLLGHRLLHPLVKKGWAWKQARRAPKRVLAPRPSPSAVGAAAPASA